ncbi:hypothetical protein LTR36_001048 [Oleoguttula mirabilis]|uniref:Uncharacterized protein n=1 Tax=Oleoguttula mirabilis TaxID=1507867 RepID=A0AAV9JP80_9PEZI|nr:hypothetical protein LTR36_001048 [Oleoguttula mirabilis]
MAAVPAHTTAHSAGEATQHVVQAAWPQNHTVGLARKHAKSDTPSIGDARSASSGTDSLPSMDMDVSTASESESIDITSEDADSISAAYLSDAANLEDQQLTAGAQPPGVFAQQLMLRNAISDAEEEHESMHEWLESNMDPWSAPKTVYGESRSEHQLALKMMMVQFDQCDMG